MPEVITVSSSDFVSRGRNGRIVSGASVWPRNSEAATLSDSAPLVPISLAITIAKPAHDPLHDAQVIEHGEQRRDEDHRRQDAEGEDEADRAAVADQRHRRRRTGRPASAESSIDVDAVAGLLEQLDPGGHPQGHQRERPLQGQAPEDHAARDRPAVVREEDRDAQDRQHPEDRADAIGDVEEVEGLGRRESPGPGAER